MKSNNKKKGFHILFVYYFKSLQYGFYLFVQDVKMGFFSGKI